MDKVKKYQAIICDTLMEFSKIKKTLTPEVKFQVMMDKENHHYQLLSIGWHNHSFVYSTAFHFDIINDQVWIQQNNTDVLIADELVEKGIPKNDIVLGFIPEKMRTYAWS